MMIRVWDPLVRVFHWSLVAAFAVAWLTADEWDQLHEWVGYAAAALIGVRLIWGLTGSHYARFSQFLYGPGAIIGYLRDMIRGREARYLGHNPAGAAMVFALLLSLSGTAFSGWLMAEPSRLALLASLPQIAAPAFADSDEQGEEEEEGTAEREGGALKDVHELLANLTLLLVVLHIGGVAFASMRHRENLARSMITGTKRAAEPGDIA